MIKCCQVTCLHYCHFQGNNTTSYTTMEQLHRKALLTSFTAHLKHIELYSSRWRHTESLQMLVGEEQTICDAALPFPVSTHALLVQLRA